MENQLCWKVIFIWSDSKFHQKVADNHYIHMECVRVFLLLLDDGKVVFPHTRMSVAITILFIGKSNEIEKTSENKCKQFLK